VSSLGLQKGAHICWLPPRKGEAPAGRIRCIWVVGKQSKISRRNTSRSPSIIGDWFARLVGSNRGSCPFSLVREPVCFAPLCGPYCTKSILPTLRKGTEYTTLGPLAPNLLSLHDLPSAASLKPLTKVGSWGYAGILKGESSYGNSAAAASGSVPGTLENQGRDLKF